MKENRHSGHTTTRLTAHVVWVTKYRYEDTSGKTKFVGSLLGIAA